MHFIQFATAITVLHQYLHHSCLASKCQWSFIIIAIIIITSILCGQSLDFAEFPSSVITEVESGVERVAVFRCRHEVIDAVISWQMSMNGSPSRLYPDVGI